MWYCQQFCFVSKKHASGPGQVDVSVKQSIIKGTQKKQQTQSKSLHFKSLFVFYDPQIQSEYTGSLTSLFYTIHLSLF